MAGTARRHRGWFFFVGLVTALAGAAFARRTSRRNDVRAEQQPTDVRFMRAMHDAIRRDLARLEAIAPSIESQRVVSEEVTAGWTTLRDALRDHHAAEDEDLWPVLRTHLRDPADLREVDAMVEEHRAIPAALDAVDAALVRRNKLTPACRELAQLVRDHLNHEERRVLPLLEQYLSRGEWRRFLRTERDRHSVRDRREFLTWVLDDASDVNRAAVMAELPRPARVIYQLVLRPRYGAERRWTLDSSVRPPKQTAA